MVNYATVIIVMVINVDDIYIGGDMVRVVMIIMVG